MYRRYKCSLAERRAKEGSRYPGYSQSRGLKLSRILSVDQWVKNQRPFSNLLLTICLPVRDFILAKKPSLLFLLRVLGWYVLPLLPPLDPNLCCMKSPETASIPGAEKLTFDDAPPLLNRPKDDLMIENMLLISLFVCRLLPPSSLFVSFS